MSQTIASGVISNGITLGVGSILYVYGTVNGVVTKTVAEINVESGGSVLNASLLGTDSAMYVYAGGTANQTTIKNGEEVVDGGNDSNAVIDGSEVQIVKNGGITHYANASASNIANGGGYQNVDSGGTAYDTTIGEYDGQNIYSGGIAIGTTINTGGEAADYSGTLSNAVVNAGGNVYIENKALNTTLDGGGAIVYSGGTGEGTTINGGGSQIISSGGTASGTTINAGGTETIQLGGTLESAFLNGGTEVVNGTLGGNINFSGTGDILQLGSTVTILSGTEITGFDVGDTIEVIGDTVTITPTQNPEIIEITLGNPSQAMVTLTPGQTLVSAPTANGEEIEVVDHALCFVAGTRITTPHGAIAIENLKIGDEVLTATGKAEKIEWIGQRSYGARFAAQNHLVLPICIKKNAIAADVPKRNLYVSPGHGIFVDGVLVPAWRLINGKTITQAEGTGADIQYYHIELASHAVILAENCPAETYLDIGSRNQFQNAASYTKRKGAAPTPLPRVEHGLALEVIKAKLNARAGIATRAENPANSMIGYVDQMRSDAVSGWALCPDDPETPVSVRVYFWIDGTLNRKTLLANIYRADVRQAGYGSGCHGFEAELPPGAKGVRIVRAADNTQLDLADGAREASAAA